MSVSKTFTDGDDLFNSDDDYSLDFLGGNDRLTTYKGTTTALMGDGDDRVVIRGGTVTADGEAFDHGTQSDQRRTRAQGKIMANDEEWVADVKRWCLAGSRSGAGALLGADDASADDAGDEIALGYEAADPALQAHHWPDAPTTGR